MEAEERQFFSTVRAAIFSNPFGTTRVELDRLATGWSPGTSDVDILPRLVEKVGRTIREVEGRRTSGRLAAEDLELLKYGKLFYTFHVFCEDYDNHILEQIRKKEECCPVVFAPRVLGMLHDFGFGATDACRFLALFFQMRRAYFFIRNIAGASKSVMNLRRALWNNVFTGDIGLYDTYLWDRMEDFSTMILGETGTGKGMAAAAIGRSGFIPFDRKTSTFSESFARAFIAINLSQYPEQLIESELFGHKKGAFTGAIEAHHGIFSRCSPYGAIFLDEIGEVGIPVQIKLLQVLQERTFSPVGSHKSEKFQGRVIAATNKNLDTARAKGEFRDDFYYRLCSDVIEVPPLRQRLAEHPAELGELLAVTVERIIGRKSDELVGRIHDYLRANQPAEYSWPGNIRELEQCVRRILLNGSYAWQKPNGMADSPIAGDGAETAEEELSAQQLLSRHCGRLFTKYGSYGAVARLTRLDRRTVKKYLDSSE